MPGPKPFSALGKQLGLQQDPLPGSCSQSRLQRETPTHSLNDSLPNSAFGNRACNKRLSKKDDTMRSKALQ